MKNVIYILVASMIMGLTACSQNTVPPNNQQAETSVVTKRVSQEEFKKQLSEHPNAQLVDVRTPNEFSAGTINNATNIDVLNSNFESKINELDKSKLTLIFCKSGGRSTRALQKMKNLGFKNVLELEGGYSRYK